MEILLVLAFIVEKWSPKQIFILENLGIFQVILKEMYMFNTVSVSAFWALTTC